MSLFSRNRSGILAAFVVAAALLLVSSHACGSSGGTQKYAGPEPGGRVGPAPIPETRPAAPPGSPNVILIIADDLDLSVFEGSTLDSTWKPEATTFTNALATTSLCCPSRASLLRGQYAHNTGLVNNLNGEPGGGRSPGRTARLRRVPRSGC